MPHSCPPGPVGTSWTAVSPAAPAVAGGKEAAPRAAARFTGFSLLYASAALGDSCPRSRRLPTDEPLTLATTGLSCLVTRTPRMSGQCTPGGAKQNLPHLPPPPFTHRKLEPKRDSGNDLAQGAGRGAEAQGGEGAGSGDSLQPRAPESHPWTPAASYPLLPSSHPPPICCCIPAPISTCPSLW